MKPGERWEAVMQLRGLTAPEKAVLGALAFHAENDSMEAWPALNTLACETGFGISAVRRAVRGLAKHGRVEVVESSLGRRSNRYRLHLLEPLQRETVPETNRSSEALQPFPSDASTPPEGTTNRKEQVNEQEAASPPSIWNLWVQMAGNEKRSVLGSLIGKYGEKVVAETVAAMTLQPPKADPTSYLIKTVKDKVGAKAEEEYLTADMTS